MDPSISAEEVRRIIGVEMSDQEVQGLIDWYATLARGLAAFPQDELKSPEPPLRSIPGPTLPRLVQSPPKRKRARSPS